MKKKRSEVLNSLRKEIKARFVELEADWNVLPQEAFSELEKVVRAKRLLIIRRGPGICDCCKKLRVTVGTYDRTKKTLYELYGV